MSPDFQVASSQCQDSGMGLETAHLRHGGRGNINYEDISFAEEFLNYIYLCVGVSMVVYLKVRK